MSLLCKLGFHKWRKNTDLSLETNLFREIKYCDRCEKLQEAYRRMFQFDYKYKDVVK